jgi:ABC-type Zn uptake system ZnuABC Zn-binding protein ZnuA
MRVSQTTNPSFAPSGFSKPRTTALALGAVLASAVLFAACDESDDDGSSTVVATTGIVADIASQVAGDDAEVLQLIPDTASPHDFQLSADDRQRLEEADLVAYNGAGLESGVPIDDVDAPTWALTENAGEPLPFGDDEHAEEDDEHAEEDEEHAEEDEEHAEEDEEHGDEGDSDPHVWMDPSRVAEAAPALGEALAEADPEHADGYRDRADAFADELRGVDSEIEQALRSLPRADRKLVTSHDALGYFADRYGFEVVATAFPASGAEAEPSAAGLQEVIDAVERTGTPALFAEETDDPEVLETVADATGAAVVSDLLVEAPGTTGTYVEMLRHDAELIRNALSG